MYCIFKLVSFCLNLFLYCCGKHHDQNQLEFQKEERLYFTLQFIVHPGEKLRKELKVKTWRQELKQKSWGTLFTGWLLTACSACFVTGFRDSGSPAQVWHYPHWARHSYVSNKLRKCPMGLPIVHIYGDISQLKFPLPIVPWLVTSKQKSEPHILHSLWVY